MYQETPKTEDHDTVSTHHQRAHVLNTKFTMFSESQKEHSLVVSMDDKTYLRPGTDVGARNTKAGVMYDVCDPNDQKKLPRQDFNNPEVNQTPASFRLIKQHKKRKRWTNKRPRSKPGHHSSKVLHWEWW